MDLELRPSNPPAPRLEVVNAPPPDTLDRTPALFSGGLLVYWRLLQRHRKVLLLATFLGGLAALLFTLPQTPVYQAKTSIEILGLNEDFLNMRNVSPTSESPASYAESDIQTQLRVLQSRSLLERVSKKLGFDYRPARDRLSDFAKGAGLFQPAAPAGGAFNLKIRAHPNSRIIDITADSKDPALAAEFVNTLTHEFIDQNLESRWKTTQDTGNWLLRQMGDVRTKLEESEEQLRSYARDAGLVFTSEKNNVEEEKLRQLQEELSKAQADRVARQSKYEVAATAAPESLPDVLDDGSLKESQSRLTDLRRQFADLTSALTAAHPKVKRVEAQIAALESALAAQRENIVRRIRNDYEAAVRRESLLTRECAEHVLLVSGQAGRVAHYNILKREVDTNRQAYDAMLQRVREAGIASAMRASNIRILDPAIPPEAPYKPDLFHNTAAGLIAGTFLGLVYVVARERAGTNVQEPGDTAAFLGVPEIGLIPSAAADPARKRRLRRHDAGRLELVTWQRKPSAMAESFRGAIASILFTAGRERPKTLVLSSPSPKEGKTMVASNLAIALAEVGAKVLLIDADLRKPRLHQVFDLENETGLADLLRRPEPVKEPLEGLLRATQIPNLTVLTSGRSTLAEAPLLFSNRVNDLLTLLRASFDLILIDTPPMLTMPDARVLARNADAVILVARANQTTKDNLQAACKKFQNDGSPLLGSILNDWNPKRSSRHGNYRYYDRYKAYYTQEAG
ncbi:MAG: GumC family protein [Acidobacteriota bacterium]